MAEFHLAGVLRRIRRRSDLSQRELAAALGISPSAVAQAESGRRDLAVGVLARAVELSGLHLAVLDDDGREVTGMADDAVRDATGRRYPAHLDTRYGDEAWWHGDERYSREQPWYTFDRVREIRDLWREQFGTPDDHQLPKPGDSPAERRKRRQAAAARRHKEEAARLREAELQRRREAGEPLDQDGWTCACPPTCAELDAGERPVHAEDCACRCDVD